MNPAMAKHTQLLLDEWKLLLLRLRLRPESPAIAITGSALDLPSVVAVSRYSAKAALDRTPAILAHVADSVTFLSEGLAAGQSFYGITTGFGGSADTRTRELEALQVALCQHLQAGVLPVRAEGDSTSARQDTSAQGTSALDTYRSDTSRSDTSTLDTSALHTIPPSPYHSDELTQLAMPQTWVRSAMLVRANSLIRGHSGVRLILTENLLELLSRNCIPQLPLRGSISASGDLHPLSYIAGLLEGNPDVLVWTGESSARQLLPAHQVLAAQHMDPIVFGPKEGLGVTNGTAVSTGVAALALHDTQHLALLAQILTAMATEALLGTADNFHPFIASTRPHPGQMEVAANIHAFLDDSRLVRVEGTVDLGGLKQDRYALRTAAQWLSPVVEDLLLAHQQLTTELNSTTDNPLVDLPAQTVHHGGNFQAAAVTSSTEKTRLALNMIGRLLFAQSSELLDVKMNNGLPPNLSADEPSLGYTFKGIDVNMAAYMSELAFVAAPASTHVQTAEMGNQGVNSLALVSARYTHTAVELVGMMCAAHLYALCQALDLRAMQQRFLDQLETLLDDLLTHSTAALLDPLARKQLRSDIWPVIVKTLADTRTLDSTTRFTTLATAISPLLLQKLARIDPLRLSSDQPASLLALITDFSDTLASRAHQLFTTNRASYLASPDATALLGTASRRMYRFVRQVLGVPMHRGIIDHPSAATATAAAATDKKTIGSRVSTIFHALRSGHLIVPVMQCAEEALVKSGRGK